MKNDKILALFFLPQDNLFYAQPFKVGVNYSAKGD